MKAITQIILIIFLCAADATAQNSKSQIGFKLLPGLTKAGSLESVNENDDYNARFTFNFGLQYIYTIEDASSFIETGIYYVDRGIFWKNESIDPVDISNRNSGYSPPGDYYNHNYYLSLPILFRKEFKHFYFSAGITVDYFLRTTLIINDNKVLDYKSISDRLFDNLELGLAFNVGTQIKLSERTMLFFEGSFHPSNFEFRKNDTYLYWNYLLGTGLTYKL